MAYDPNQPGPRGERGAYVEDDGPTHAELAEGGRRNRSLAVTGVILGSLAAIAAAVALVFVFLDDDESGGDRPRGASQESVSSLRDDVRELEGQVEELDESTEPARDAAQQIEDVQGRLEQLQQDQQELAGTIQDVQQRIEDALSSLPGGGGDGGGTETTP